MESFFLWVAICGLCLGGCLSYWRLSRLLSPCSKTTENLVLSSLEEFKSTKKRLEAEWEDVYGKMMSIAGRMDRANSRTRGRPPSPENSGDPPDLLGELNVYLAQNRAK